MPKYSWAASLHRLRAFTVSYVKRKLDLVVFRYNYYESWSVLIIDAATQQARQEVEIETQGSQGYTPK